MYLFICMLAVSVQAVLIDDFEDGNLVEYTSTVILDTNGNPHNTASWQITNDQLQISTTVQNGIDQYAFIYGGLSLPVGAELQMDVNRTPDSQDIGLYVGGTTPADNVRQDYVAVYARNNGQVFSRGFDGSTEYPLEGGATPAGLESLFIARTSANTYVTGYYDNGARTIISTRTPAFANEGDVVGFYADVRLVGVNGNADNLSIISRPTNPSVTQVQDLISGGVDVTLNWSAGVDPLGVFEVDPDIADQYVFLSGDNLETDPNLYYVGTTGDPGTSDPNSSLTVQDLLNLNDYNWAVVEAFAGNTQSLTVGVSTLASVDPNNLIGPTWSFTTISEEPDVSAVDPAYIAVEAGTASVVLSVTSPNVSSYQWFKVGNPDSELEDAVGVYSGTDTDTLTIFDIQLADEGFYYCVGTNTAGSLASEPGRVMTTRLTSHYPFETTQVVDGNTVTPDIVDGFDAVLTAEGGQAAPGLADANQLDASLGLYLELDNADNDPNGQYALLPAGVVDYEDLTISAWIHPKGGTVWGRLFDFGNTTTDYLFLTPDNGAGALRFATRIDNGGEQQLSGTWLPSNQWHHVAVTISGNTGRLYRNGELVDTNPNMTLNPIDVGAVLNYIGKSQYTVDPELNALIDELKIYNYALTAQEIGQAYVDLIGGSVCNYELYDLTYDFDEDCQVNLSDFAMFVSEWLNDYLITP